jgi:hypothetical protein
LLIIGTRGIATMHHPGRVYDNIEAPESSHGFAHDPISMSTIRYVTQDRTRLTTRHDDLIGDGVRSAFITTTDHDRGT